MLDGGGAAVEAAVPVQVQAPVPEATTQANQKIVAAEKKTQTKPTQEKGKNSPETPENVEKNKGGEVSPEQLMEIADTIDQADIDSVVVPEANEVILRVLATEGDHADFLTKSGEVTRERVIKEENKPLTSEQQQQIALGYDLEIAGLEMKLHRSKDMNERGNLFEEIKVLKLKRENDVKEIKENQLDGFVKMLDKDGDFIKFINRHDKNRNETPAIAIEKILRLAAVDKNIRPKMLFNLKEAGASEDQISVIDKNLNNIAENIKKEGGEKLKAGAKAMSLLSLAAMILTMYSGFSKKEPGMG